MNLLVYTATATIITGTRNNDNCSGESMRICWYELVPRPSSLAPGLKTTVLVSLCEFGGMYWYIRSGE